MALRRQTRNRDMQTGTQQNDGHEQITDRATYRVPMLAILDGTQLVRVIATGDAPGHSPVLQYATNEGFEWAEEERFRPADPNLLLPSADAIGETLRALSQVSQRAGR